MNEQLKIKPEQKISCRQLDWMEELEAANVIQGFGRKQLMIIRLLIMKRGGDSRAILIIKRGEHDPYFDGDIFRFNTIMIFS